MFQFLRRRGRRPAVGIAFDGAGAGVAVVRRASGGRAPALVAGGYVEDESALGSWTRRHRLARAPAVALLAPGEYQVFQIDTPAVPAEEMRIAAGWKIRELIDYPPEEAVVDTFELPEAAQRGGAKVNVVAARARVVAARIARVREAGLALAAVDIPELAQGEASAWLPGDDRGHALLALERDAGLITVYRDGEQYLARSLDTGRSALEAGEDGIESVVLEVQRSFDYFESAMSQAPVGALYLHPANEEMDGLAREVESRLDSVECRSVALGHLVDVEAEPEPAGATLLHALGAALGGGEARA